MRTFRFLGLWFVLVLLGVPVFGINCNALVVDQAGVFNDPAVLETAARSLADTGADPHVLAVDSFGGGNLDRYEANLEDECASSWKGNDGSRKNNLLVLIVAIREKKMGLYYGSLYKSLGDHWLRIQQDQMKPRFRAKDFQGGMVGALEEISRLTEAALHPHPIYPPGGSSYPEPKELVVDRAPAGPPADLSWVGGTVLWIFKALLVLLGLGVVWYFFRMSRDRKAARHAAQLEAKSQKAKCFTASSALRVQAFLSEAQVVIGQISEEDGFKLQQTFSALKQDDADLAVAVGDLALSVGDPDRDQLTTEEYQQIARRYQEMNERVEGVRRSLSGAQDLLAQIQALPKRILACAQQVEAAEGNLDDADQAFDGIAKTFAPASWKPLEQNTAKARKELATAAQRLDEARTAMTGKWRVGKANTALALATRGLEEATELVAAITSLGEELATAQKEAPLELETAAANLAEAQAYYEAHKDDCDPERAGELEAAGTALQQTKALLEQPLPDFVAILRSASDIRERISTLHSASQSEYKAAERKRKRAREQSNAGSGSYRGSGYGGGYGGGNTTVVVVNDSPFGGGYSSPDTGRSWGSSGSSDNNSGGGSSGFDFGSSGSNDSGGGSSSFDFGGGDSGGGGGSSDF